MGNPVHVMVSICVFWDQSYKDAVKLWMQVRDDDGRFHGKWEFPGGGIEKGESAEQAMVREIDEEVGIKLDQDDKRKLFKVFHYDYEDHQVHLHTYLVRTNKIPEEQGKWFVFNSDQDADDFVGKTPDANPAIIKEIMSYINDLRKNGVENLIWN